MATVGTLIVRLFAQTGQFTKEMERATSKIEHTARAAERASETIAIAMGVIGVAAGVAAGAAVKLAAEWEQAGIAFTTLLDSGEKAKDFLVDLEQFASTTPFELPGIMSSGRKLLAFGWQAEQVIPTMTAIGDAIAALGYGEQEIASVTRALGQMKAKGTVQAQEMTRQLAEVGIPAWDFLAEKIGTDVPTAMKLVEKRAIPASVGITSILEGMTRKFGGAMEKQSRTLIGLWSTLKDEGRALGRGLGGYLAEAFNLKGLMEGTIGAFRILTDEIRNADSLAEGFRIAMNRLFHPALRPVILGIAGAIAGALYPAIAVLGKFIKGALISLAPFMIKGAAVALVAYAIYQAWSDAAGGIAAVGVFLIRVAASVVGALSIFSFGLLETSRQMHTWANQIASASKRAQTATKGFGDTGYGEQMAKQYDITAKGAENAAYAQEQLGNKTEEAAKQANKNLMSFDQVHQMQEDMGAAAANMELPGIGDIGEMAFPSIPAFDMKFDLGPFEKLSEVWGTIKTHLDAAKVSMEGLGHVITGVLIVKLGVLGTTAISTAVKVGIAFATKNTAALTSLAIYKKSFAFFIGRWVGLGIAAAVNAGKVVGSFALMVGKALISVATQAGAFALLLGKWTSIGIAATVNAAKIAGAWLLQKTKALISLAAQVPTFVTLAGKWLALGVQAGISAAKVASAWLLMKSKALVSVAAQAGSFALLGVKWITLGAKALIGAGKFALAWIIALGPIAWVVAAVIGVATLIILNWEWIKTETLRIWDIVSNWLKTTWEAISATATTIWNGISGFFGTTWTTIDTAITTTWNGIKKFLSTTWGGISNTAKTIWENIKDFVTNPVTTIQTALNTAWETISKTATTSWESISDTATRIWNGVRDAIRGAINGIIGSINRFIRAFNGIQISVPAVNIPLVGKVGGFSIGVPQIPTIPMLAQGTNYVPKDMYAFLHKGEAVVPKAYNQNDDDIPRAVYQAIIDAFRMANRNDQSQEKEIVLNVDGIRLARVILPAFIKEEQRQGMIVRMT